MFGGTPILPRLNKNANRFLSPSQPKLWTAVYRRVPPTWLPKSSHLLFFINIIFNGWLEVPESLFSSYLGNLLRLNPTCSPRAGENRRKRPGLWGGLLFSGFLQRNSPLTYYLSFWSSPVKRSQQHNPCLCVYQIMYKMKCQEIHNKVVKGRISNSN